MRTTLALALGHAAVAVQRVMGGAAAATRSNAATHGISKLTTIAIQIPYFVFRYMFIWITKYIFLSGFVTALGDITLLAIRQNSK